ncbi:hypothetical protein F8C76_10210 [Flagellimonas olearia]|uniref:DUF2971 domain-containing protein n=1 Tax=Flagellimonas olearia TaxID=552546 RepID=A0A6I1DU57_9FLAO|nr:DUF2971 domain-containing protein [Allomuricauda olearia]KAB7528235.1 hypothetical protein F8C76_10210 [Allomuricauda olearia]
MSWTKEYQGTLDDIEIPKVVYKYRHWEFEHHDKFIKNREVFLASPESFEDEKDCRNPIRYDLLDAKQTIELYETVSRREHPSRTRYQHRNEARKWARKGFLKDKNYQKEYEQHYNKEMDKRQGVLSLTAECCLDEMWKKYAKDGEGFCIGYNSRIMFEYLGGGAAVEYFDKLPAILPRPFMPYHQITYYKLYCKELKWKFEREYRTVKFWEQPASIEDRKVILPKEAFKEIILGDKISGNNRKEIIHAVKTNIGDIPILEKKIKCFDLAL